MLTLARTVREALRIARDERGYLVAPSPFAAGSLFAPDDTVTTAYGHLQSVSASANTKGNWDTYVASTPWAVGGLVISGQLRAATSFFLDVGVGGSAQTGWTTVVPNLLLGYAAGTTNTSFYTFVPIFIRKGTTIGMRVAASTGSASPVTLKINLVALSALGISPPRRWVAWGADATATLGTAVTNGNGANNLGAWVQLVASTDFTTRWVLVEIRGGSLDNINWDLAVAAVGNEANGIKLRDVLDTNENQYSAPMLLPWRIPGGSRIAGRIRSATGNSFTNMMLHGGS